MMNGNDLGIDFVTHTLSMGCLHCNRIETFTFDYLWYAIIGRVEVPCRGCWSIEWTHNWQGIVKKAKNG